MAIKAKFYWMSPQGIKQMPRLTFVLKNDNWLKSERFNLMFYCRSHDLAWMYRGIEISPGETLIFNQDTIGWRLKYEDSIMIVDDSGKTITEWAVSKIIAESTECPSCHNTKKCPYCNGLGMVKSKYGTSQAKASLGFSRTVNPYMEYCNHCNGTGVCMDCYMPHWNLNKDQPVNIQPSYIGSRIRMNDPFANLPYIPKDDRVRLKQLNEQIVRTAQASVNTGTAIASGASQAVVGGFQTIENREKDKQRNI